MEAKAVTEFDCVVIGTGTGMFAALAAADAGMSVLLVEKSEYVGGSTALSGGGIWVPGNRVLVEAGARDSSDRVERYLDHVTAGETTRARWGAVIDHGPAAIDLLRRRTPLSFQWIPGYADYRPELPGGSAAGRTIEPRPFDATRLGADRALLRPSDLTSSFPFPVTGRSYRWLNLLTRHPRGVLEAVKTVGTGVGGLALRREYVAGGSALAAGLFAGVRSAGIPVWRNTPLVELVVRDGRVTGVVVERDGRNTEVSAARGVILAAGGFEHNAAMRRRYQSARLAADWSFGNPANTGDAIALAHEQVGAALVFMDEAWWFPAMPTPGGPPLPLLAERSLPGQLIVDRAGRRFMNEALEYMSAGHELLRRDLPVWMIFDRRYRERYVVGATVLPRQPMPQSWYDAGIVVQAPTLGELADRLDLPHLPQTVDRFNLLAAAGRDDDFERGVSAYDRYYGDPGVTPNPCLGPVERAPFYALQLVPGDLGTCGGVQADGVARALRDDGSVIDGLYAIGNTAGNAFGRTYPGAGATIGQGLTFGYVAARHAAGLV